MQEPTTQHGEGFLALMMSRKDVESKRPNRGFSVELLSLPRLLPQSPGFLGERYWKKIGRE